MRGRLVEREPPELMRGEQERRAEALDLQRAARLTRETRPETTRREENEGENADSDHPAEDGGSDHRRPATLAPPDVEGRTRERRIEQPGRA